MLTLLLALAEIAIKVWRNPNKLKAIKNLSNAERFVLHTLLTMLVLVLTSTDVL